MAVYIAIIHKDSDSSFGASFPDLPGCISAADTLEELRPMIEESLGLHLEGMIEDGEAVPEPSPLDKIVNSSLVAVFFRYQISFSLQSCNRDELTAHFLYFQLPLL